MDKIYNFKAATNVGHLKTSADNEKQFYSEEETRAKDTQEKQLKKTSKPPSKMS